MSFNAAEGRIVGFLGPNGAGKTTALSIMSGYMEPTAGSVRVCGFDIAKERKQAMRIMGYLPENPPLYPEMTVMEYLRFAAGLKGFAGKKGALEACNVMKLTDIVPEKEKLIGQLSKGTKQRVAIAGAIVGTPKVLLLDEPSNGLDPGQTAGFKKVLKNLKESGTTIVISSHILSQISAVCDDMLVINRGRLIAAGTKEYFEKKFLKEAGFLIDIPAEASECERVLSPLKPLCNVRFVGKTATGGCTYSLNDYKTDIKKQLFENIANEGLYIERLAPSMKSLEEVYLGMIEASEAEFEKAQKRVRRIKTEMIEKGESDENDLL